MWRRRDVMRASFYSGASIQNRRTTNMDSLLIKERAVLSRNVLLAAVCDGVGGLEDGAFASAYAARALNKWIDEITDAKRLGLRMRDKILEIDREIISQAKAEGLQTASTLSALLLVQSKFYIVHTGDSRIYNWTRQGLKQLTIDQSQGGKLTACLGHPGYQSLTYNEGLCSGQNFLLCSDGLYKRMNMDYLYEKLMECNQKNIQNTIKQLIQFVVERGETDNISVALIMFEN